jgi:hypothetical protein
VAAAALMLVPLRSPAAEYYVDPVAGSNNNPGTAAQPWQTLPHAISRVKGSDVLVLRPGTHAVSGSLKLNSKKSGTSSSPTTIRGEPGAVIDGGLPEFRATPNPDWEAVDAARFIYRSARTYSSAGTVHAYLSHGGIDHHLVPYTSNAHLLTDNQAYSSGAIYVGQGTFWDPNDQRIYIRLQATEAQAALGFADPPSLDPTQVKIEIHPSRTLFYLDGVSHVRIEDLEIKGRNRLFEVESAAHDIVLRDLHLRGGQYPITLRDESYNITLDGLRVVDALLPWVAWHDVKSGSRPAKSYQGAIIGTDGSAVHHIELMNSVILGGFDVVDLPGAPHHFYSHHNRLEGFRDDAYEFGTAGYEFHVDHNVQIGPASCASYDGSGPSPQPGRVFIHHNVCDSSHPTLWIRAGQSTSRYVDALGRAWIAPFNSHGSGAPDAWRIYQNTVVCGRDHYGEGCNFMWRSTTAPGLIHTVLNNIFVQTGNDRFATDAKRDLQLSDGNLYWRPVAGATRDWFTDYDDEDYRDLAELRAAFGWELAGIEADPGLDADYRPGSAAAGGVTLPADWPGATESGYRGALPPRAP